MALHFNGDAIMSIASLSPTVNIYCSMCMWIRITQNTTIAGIAILRDSIDTADTITFRINGLNTVELLKGSTTASMFVATLNTWYFIAVACDQNSTTYNYYWSAANGAGGVLNSGSLVDAFQATNYNSLDFGDAHGGGGSALPYIGDLAAAKIWSGATLSKADFQNEMWSQRAVRTDGIYTDYPFLTEPIGQYDLSGNGHTLTYSTNHPSTTLGPPTSQIFR